MFYQDSLRWRELYNSFLVTVTGDAASYYLLHIAWFWKCRINYYNEQVNYYNEQVQCSQYVLLLDGRHFIEKIIATYHHRKRQDITVIEY